jgi:hypothetical protein
LIDSYEQLKLYNIQVEYPISARLELNPKSTREQGDVVFHFDQYSKVMLSWGQLEGARNRYSTAEAQAADSIKRATSVNRVRDLKVIRHDELAINGHTAAYYRTEFEVTSSPFLIARGLGKQETHSIHLHCPESGRYYVIYGSSTSPKDSENQWALLRHLSNSLKCH